MLIFIGLFGITIGSFLGLSYWRMPNNESVIFPRSFCPLCKKTINYFDNIPFLSWIILKGKCRNCSNRISKSYPLIEISTALLWISAYFASPNNFSTENNLLLTFCGGIFFSYLFLLSLLDIKYLWLPNSLCFQGLIFGLIFSFLYSYVLNNSQGKAIFFEHSITAVSALIIMEILCISLKKIFGKELLGRGDAKLISMGSAWLGIQGILIATCLGFWLASLYGIFGRLTNRLEPFQYIPFGPFLSIGYYMVWIIGSNNLWQYWEKLII